jgi:hypothetical protein
MTDLKLDLDELRDELREVLDEASAYKIERLLHTYVANPVTGIFTQVEIIKRALEKRPDMLPGEVENLSKQVKLASDNIVIVVKALAAAFPQSDD